MCNLSEILIEEGETLLNATKEEIEKAKEMLLSM